MKAKDVMTQHVITIALDASILEALRLMLQHGIIGLPVVDNNGTLAASSPLCAASIPTALDGCHHEG
jgi:CBS domain-containing protein